MSEAARRLTLARAATAELEEKRSVFIADAAPVATEDSARAFLEQIRHRHADAGHHVYAYLLQNGAIARYSDDGEPQGTAGIPALNVLKMSGACDLCVVITRYFGGILLGTGGLARAYSAAARRAIDAAGIVAMEPYTVGQIRCGYAEYQKLTVQLPRWGAVEEDASFSDVVLLTASVRTEEVAHLQTALSELTGGKVMFEALREEERPAAVFL